LFSALTQKKIEKGIYWKLSSKLIGTSSPHDCLSGQIFSAIGNKSTHMGCALSNGTLNGDTVQCACHGSVFNVKTGDVIRGPAKKPEQKYELQISSDQILLSM
jgi:nitrite reductase/ring-hydroxylating ferredoxin subunit